MQTLQNMFHSLAYYKPLQSFLVKLYGNYKVSRLHTSRLHVRAMPGHRQSSTRPRRIMHNQSPPLACSRKRSSEDSIEITDVREAKKQCRLKYASISIPRNDADTYAREEQQHLFYTFCPLDRTNLNRALKQRFLSHVVYGMHANRVVEALMPDEETKIPWTVPKVTVEFKRIDYVSEQQPYTTWSLEGDGRSVGPTTMPSVKQMSRDEYEEAVERGDRRVASGERSTFDFCMDMKSGWLPYEDR